MHTGGAERVAAHLANAWAARGDRVTLVATFSGRGDCHYQLDPKVRLIFLADLVQGKGLSGFWNRLTALRNLIRSDAPDAVVSFLTNVNILALLATVGMDVPVIVSERTYPGSFNPGRALSVMRRFTYPRASRVVMLASKGIEWLSHHIPQARGAVIFNPVTYPLAKSQPFVDTANAIFPNRKILLGAGRIDDDKQFDKLILAFGKLARTYLDWDVVIVGEGPRRAALEELIERLDLGSRVFLPGRVGNVGDWYGKSDIYVMSSRVEGFPNTLAEAMAHGCAAISFDCDTGPRDIIADGVNGLLVQPVGDVEKLANAMELLMTDEKLRERMQHEACEIRDRFSTASILKEWDGLFLAIEAD